MSYSIYFSFLCALVGASLITSCYRMPNEDDYCMIPLTNHSDFKRSGDELVPKVAY